MAELAHIPACRKLPADPDCMSPATSMLTVLMRILQVDTTHRSHHVRVVLVIPVSELVLAPPSCSSNSMNETLLPTDHKRAGEIVDDELNAYMVRPLQQGVTLHAIIDACHRCVWVWVQRWRSVGGLRMEECG
jgi:hypothetical protein